MSRTDEYGAPAWRDRTGDVWTGEPGDTLMISGECWHTPSWDQLKEDPVKGPLTPLIEPARAVDLLRATLEESGALDELTDRVCQLYAHVLEHGEVPGA